MHMACSLSVTLLGPIVYLNVAGQHIVVLNTMQAASGLLDKQGSICSDRPKNIVVNEYLTGGFFIAFMGYSERLVDVPETLKKHLTRILGIERCDASLTNF